jgi:hypothetical protein
MRKSCTLVFVLYTSPEIFSGTMKLGATRHFFVNPDIVKSFAIRRNLEASSRNGLLPQQLCSPLVASGIWNCHGEDTGEEADYMANGCRLGGSIGA